MKYHSLVKYLIEAGRYDDADRVISSVIAAPKLTPKDMKQGTVIRNKQNPEWGDWVVNGPAKGVPGVWEIRKSGRSGASSRTLDKGELHFWELIKSA